MGGRTSYEQQAQDQIVSEHIIEEIENRVHAFRS